MEHKKRYRSKSKWGGALMLTSIMDLMTIILCYLLKLFSTEGVILTQAENLVLPLSTSKKSPTDVVLAVEVSNTWVLVDHIPVVRTPNVRDQSELSVSAVKEKLEVAMLQEEKMVKIGALQRVKGELVMQVDKNVDYDVLYKVMATCGEVGYSHIRFAVMSKEEE